MFVFDNGLNKVDVRKDKNHTNLPNELMTETNKELLHKSDDSLPNELCLLPTKIESSIRKQALKFGVNTKQNKTIRQNNKHICLGNSLRNTSGISNDEIIPLLDEDIGDHLYEAVINQSKPEIAAKHKMIHHRMQYAHKSVSELIREHHFSDDLFSLEWWTRSKKKESPFHELNLQKGDSATSANSCTLIVEIVKCNNLPVRKLSSLGYSFYFIDDEHVPGFSRRYSRAICRSVISECKSKNIAEYCPSSLESIQEHIHINIYDHVIIEKQSPDYRQPSTRIKHYEERWLGGIALPFSTVYMNGLVEAHVQVGVPVIHLGYQNASISYSTFFQVFFFQLYLKICVFVQHSNILLFVFARFIDRWCEELRAKYPGIRSRTLELFVPDKNNEPVLITKFVRSLEPPMKVAPDIFIRFVSSIPFQDDIHFIPGARDVWTTCSEFLELGYGDWEEHALLLANFFLWYEQQNPSSGWQTFLAVGKGMPEGNTVYVLRRNIVLKTFGAQIDRVVLVNAVTGRAFTVPEVKGTTRLCPLNDISLVFNSEQIWVNIQSTDILPCDEKFSYQLENESKWKPLFNDKENMQHITKSSKTILYRACNCQLWSTYRLRDKH
ncbi:hypothetical protein RFI_13084 [Reticulomyxa filosa]|uniref:CEP76/DRC7 peptidase-like domain-containing protein n=1 Tax=Reticulomyxa filosa TaxID=46433 RepID=X6NDJ5_RETFI|nr:hypothetical protein RFI_13084 [Reticulomyxa filosa]|eukprot:ETO24076.1 hypothetical protein RFI_13084 [Reticulomyxa filosa]